MRRAPLALLIAAVTSAVTSGCSPVLGLLVRAIESASADDQAIALDARVEGSTRDAPDRFRPPCGAPDGGGDRAYTLRVPEDGLYRIDVQARYDAVVALFDAEGSALACNDDHGRTTHSMLERELSAGRAYLVVVDGFRGETGDFSLLVTRVVPPAPDAVGEPLALRRWVRGDTTERGDGFTPPCGASAGSPDQLWVFTPERSGTYSITVRAGFDAVLAVYPPEGQGDAPIGCNDDDRNPRLSRLELPLVAGQPYRVVVDGYEGASGSYAIAVGELGGGAGARAAVRGVLSVGRPVAGDTQRSSDGHTFGCGTTPGSPDDTWRFRAAREGRYRFRLESTHDGALALYEVGGAEPLGCNDDAGSARVSELELPLERGRVYDVVVDGHGGARGAYTLTAERADEAAAGGAAAGGAASCAALPRAPEGLSAGQLSPATDRPPSCGAGGAAARYRLRSPRAGRLTVRVESVAPVTLELRRGCAAEGEALACVPAAEGARLLEAALDAGVDYALAVHAPAGTEGTFTLSVTLAAEPEAAAPPEAETTE